MAGLGGVQLPGKACRQWRGDPADKTAAIDRAPSRPTLPGTLLSLSPLPEAAVCSPGALRRRPRPKPLIATVAPSPGSTTGSSPPPGLTPSATPSPAGLDSKVLIPEHVGARVHERYVVDPQKELGAGGNGRVFLATDREAGDRKVAIKKIVIMDSNERDAFKKELLITKDLDHPNICKVFESYDEGRNVYIVMEYCEGGALFDRIVEREALTESASASVAGQVASALKYAHGRGIAHRDLKPENVCFCSRGADDGLVKVIDWGVGSRFGVRRMRSSVGSLAYAAPEVLEPSGCYTAACDLWSLGVMTYVMLCGELPFDGELGGCMLEEGDICLEVSARWAQVPADAQDFVRGLLQTDPAQRTSIDGVLAHPWLKSKDRRLTLAAAEQIFENLRHAAGASRFYSLCCATVVRQLDDQRLEDLREAFCEMDANGDGVLELHEVRAGFERVFGKDCPQLRDLDEIFAQLDLNGSGAVDYTEFCAAAIGQRVGTEDGALRAAFRAFDACAGGPSGGRLGRAEVAQILASADVGKVWPQEAYEQIARETMELLHGDGDGTLGFDEWLRLIRESAAPGAGQGAHAGEDDAMRAGGVGHGEDRAGAEDSDASSRASAEEVEDQRLASSPPPRRRTSRPRAQTAPLGAASLWPLRSALLEAVLRTCGVENWP